MLYLQALLIIERVAVPPLDLLALFDSGASLDLRLLAETAIHLLLTNVALLLLLQVV